MPKTISIYLQAILLYLKVKMGSQISKEEMWHLDFVIFSWQHKVSLLDKNHLAFLVKINLPGGEKKVFIRHWPKSDFSVFKSVLCPDKQYEKAASYFNNKAQPLRILDGGANVGYTSVYFKCLFPNSSIIAVEPEGNNFDALRKNCVINNFENIHGVNAALWYENGKLAIDNSFRDHRDHSFSVQETKADSGLDGFKITDLIRKYDWESIDVLKLDIEGAEAKIFKHDNDLIQFLPKIKLVIIEIHDEFDCRDLILNLFTANQFSLVNDGELTYAYNNRFV